MKAVFIILLTAGVAFAGDKLDGLKKAVATNDFALAAKEYDKLSRKMDKDTLAAVMAALPQSEASKPLRKEVASKAVLLGQASPWQDVAIVPVPFTDVETVRVPFTDADGYPVGDSTVAGNRSSLEDSMRRWDRTIAKVGLSNIKTDPAWGTALWQRLQSVRASVAAHGWTPETEAQWEAYLDALVASRDRRERLTRK